ncbi:hypothetical protein BOX15_Mlig005963g6 [Macrostomum lignano]|uniref:Osteopetrosis-associated transmembrane protein 1 n=1 Tax=Macrostomum lignano TaxID=282301 RepID=A0A267H2L6_9PLAT|nr:hypothetical protein BOX15_Mlig005963g6 [Macrostomum lignano]
MVAVSAPTMSPAAMNCTAFQYALSRASAELTDCMCRAARPFTLCAHCYHSRAKYADLHQLLVKDDGKDLSAAPDGTSCRKYLMQLDSVQVLSRTRDFVESVWRSSNCNNCFSSNGGSSQNDSLPRYRSDLDQFFNDTTQLRECFANYSSASSNQSGPSIVCDKCSSLYSALTIRFDTLSNAEHTRDRNTHSLCMDAVDAMNATHRLWSEAYQCDSRVRSLQPLPLIIAGYLTAVLFYIGARGRGQFKQRKLLRQKRLGCFASSSGAVSGSASDVGLLKLINKIYINNFQTHASGFCRGKSILFSIPNVHYWSVKNGLSFLPPMYIHDPDPTKII